MAYIFYIIFFIAVFFVALTVAWAAFSFAPWVPMKSRDLQRIFQLADMRPGEVFYDVGWGNGKVALYAARRCRVRAVGLELALPLFWLCQLRRLFSPRADVIFKWRNLFFENLSGADVVYFFGIPSTISKKLKHKLEQELKPGARVISYAFRVDGWQPAAVSKPDGKSIPVYLYVR